MVLSVETVGEIADDSNSNGSTAFADPAVQGFFKATKATKTPATSPTSDSPGPKSSPSSSNTGAIAGGAVGGVAALAIISLLVWFLLRRRRPKYEQPGHHKSPWDTGSSPLPGELEDKQRRYEMHGRRGGHEAPEMEARPAQSGPFEMASEKRGSG